MTIDFKQQFGVNAGYVESLFEQWRQDPSAVDEEWGLWFTSVAAEAGTKVKEQVATTPTGDDKVEVEPLRGVSASIARNMNASLAVPTATSVRTIPVKVLEENRRIINAHMRVRALGKASYTHFIAYAMVQAIKEQPNVQSFYKEIDGKPYRMSPKHINVGMAIDVGTSEQRSLVVPNIKGAEAMNFKQFYDAYQDIVARGRAGKLGAADFAETTFSITNPGGFGTEASVPRLMQGQGLILATGSIGVPVQARSMNPAMLAEIAMSPVMTITSTYDHRTVQGAESGLLLKRIEELLDDADGFWADIFKVLRVPWTPARLDNDHHTLKSDDAAAEQAKVWQLISAYRTRGCQLADLDPLEYKPDMLPSLDPSWYGFTIWDLDREFLTDGMCGRQSMTLREILEVLRETYCRRWTIEYMHIVNRERKHWVRERVEGRSNDDVFGEDSRLRILQRLVAAENFEQFLHTRYPGNKRFSLEGADTLIPAISEIIDRAADRGVKRVVIGMAHRGRLNVLANILNKSYTKIFSEFEGVMLPGEAEGSGDVKYHLGARGVYSTPCGKDIEVVLTANPSHLEAVNPVVAGQVRAYQDLDGDTERKQTIGILVHGDAAFTGQGVVTESLQMSDLPGYKVGGIIHIVVNNQIGFTAGPKDLYSTYYCTDLAKMIEAPIMHANGDYPESVMKAVHVALDYQANFGADAVIDMVCYRRRGHNEGDEPMYTQPLLYQKISNHPSVRKNYTDLLVRRGMMTQQECDAVGDEFDRELKAALEASRKMSENAKEQTLELAVCDETWCERDWCDDESPHTSLDLDELKRIIVETNTMPEGHVVHPNLLRQLKRREEMISGDRDLDWGCAEVFALGSLIKGGVGLRLAGQDSGRGTFSHRHAVVRHQQTGADYLPLSSLNEDAHVEVRDSLLSEEAALSFEYGYALANLEAMVVWEAQFGDFANGAQIPIDQFISAGEAKWSQLAGLTLLLPHGYDGQGPEHSNARPERFLQLCAEGNMTVANCSTAAQYFHLLRRQGLAGKAKRPLVVFTPKSMLRDPRAASARERFAE
ncbi:MAG: multifunctional oxoglutarate decarboxylase/oxoglutarate dehydrogenase thiamine pyrophosphate-binding subunit/dihydrolipoyllysine-residue succinyltransferase subunit, partial [Planctomycetota bacterium]|nr:multifunctional oxoglutarate decarboxylase/oxoglutarate dehydrogenase thiamine pyrophosphate-binding subunit/dihydrolipoyllysine-residue succinyltransferase subunit [Planctomycetota bacterium]